MLVDGLEMTNKRLAFVSHSVNAIRVVQLESDRQRSRSWIAVSSAGGILLPLEVRRRMLWKVDHRIGTQA